MKTKMKAIIVIISTIFYACSNLDIVESKTISENVEFSRYDSESKMRYNVYNNASHLQVILSTNDKENIAKILKGGLTIYFDDQGKKGKATYVTYPTESMILEMNEGNQQRNQPPEIKTLIQQVPNLKIYSHQGKVQNFTKLEGDIEIKLYSKGEELFYEILIPIERISNKTIPELQEITIGAISGTLEMPEGRGDQPSGMNGGGGMPPQGSGGGRPQGGGPPQGGERPDMQSMDTSMELWFKAMVI